jgi:hypothetical protein
VVQGRGQNLDLEPHRHQHHVYMGIQCMSESVKKVVERNEDGTFPKGKSGNPAGRPKGSKNAITLLKQSLELQLREKAAPDMGAVLEKAVEMALDGHPGMIKLLLDMHVSKGTNEDAKGSEKVAIQINSAPGAPKPVIIDNDTGDSNV